MARPRDFVAEIQARRGRAWLYPTTVPDRLRELARAYEKPDQLNPELLRYAPIAIIALVESFFREAVKALIDKGSPFLDNALASHVAKDLRLEPQMLTAVAGKSITIGDLISHSLRIKSVEGIESVMTALSGVAFFKTIGTLHDRWDVEVMGKPKTPIIDDLDKVLAVLAKAFSYRHVYAHESADKFPISPEDVLEMLMSGKQLLEASAEFMSNTLHPGAPLTQVAMNMAAGEEYERADSTLSEEVAKVRAGLGRARLAAFDAAQEAWTEYRRRTSEFDGLEYEGGSMRPLIEAITLKRVTEARIEELRNWMGQYE